jgi:hypothetical protein
VVLVLVMVSLIALVALAGFLFGMMDSSGRSAQVTAQLATCSSSGSDEVCIVKLTNLGSGNVATTGSCSLGAGGVKGTVGSGGTVLAGGTLSVSCTVAGITVSAGGTVTGSISLANGASAYFEGTAS